MSGERPVPNTDPRRPMHCPKCGATTVMPTVTYRRREPYASGPALAEWIDAECRQCGYTEQREVLPQKEQP